MTIHVSRNISKPVVGKATNNTAEIQACIEALKTVQKRGMVFALF